MERKLVKWGNSIGIRLPRHLVDQAALKPGDAVDVAVSEDGRIVITPRRRRPTLDELLRGITEENRHHEAEWGEPAGEEAW